MYVYILYMYKWCTNVPLQQSSLIIPYLNYQTRYPKMQQTESVISLASDILVTDHM